MLCQFMYLLPFMLSNLPTEYLYYDLNFVLICPQVSSLDNSFIQITKSNLLRILIHFLQ